MAKASVKYFCKECGYEAGKWLGQCPACRAWNSFVEEPVTKTVTGFSAATRRNGGQAPKPRRLEEIQLEQEDRLATGFSELDRVLGGGIVVGSMVLVGGDPGIGKSTLLLQVCGNLANTGKSVLYVSGEESLKQIKLRAQRLPKIEGELRFLCDTSVENIISLIESLKPDMVVVDSIQTMSTELVTAAPGSVSQVRESSAALLRAAKTENAAVFVVGHVTKEGTVAGPRVLEHMVDAVLYFEGEGSGSLRILRGQKNRFGSTNELAVFEMHAEGLQQILNPSEMLLSGRPIAAPGSVVSCGMEGTRPLLLEIQGLVAGTSFGMPRRTANGVDYNRINLLLAIMEKRLGLDMSRLDAYVNIAGGIKIAEPSMDLAIITALISSYKNLALPEDMLVFGEVGLAGEVRAVSFAQQRIDEAAKLGFKRIVMPAGTASKKLKTPPQVQIFFVRNIKEVLTFFKS